MRRASRRPYVLVNMAMTADGKIATVNHAVESFSSKRDQTNLLRLRATADAVMCGAATGSALGVTLDSGGPQYRRMRLRRGLAESPLRVIVSGHLRLRQDADIFRSPGGPLLILTCNRAPERRMKALKKLATCVVRLGEDRVDLHAAMRWLHTQWNVRRMVCEGGGELNDAMIRAGLVDELHLTVCPVLFGGRDSPTIADGCGVPALSLASPWQLHRWRRIGDEFFLVFRAGTRP
jgi:riboflavin-specific deaminase-like protein